MSDRRVFKLVHESARRNAISTVARAPDGFVVEIKPATRSLDQNAKLHAMFADVAAQCTFHGKKRTAEQWKVIFISAHSIATKEGGEILAGLEGEFVNIRESSARMSIKRMNSLIEYMLAWGAENEVEWSDPGPQGFDEIRGAA